MEEDYPCDQLEFDERFATEAACQDYLERLRWPEGFACPRCGHRSGWKTKRQQRLCAACLYAASMTAGTIFQDTHKPLRLWFRAIWYVTGQKYGASALGLQRILGLGSYVTAWSWLHKLRRAMVRPGRDRLSGTIEVDEVYVGGERSGKRGRGAEGKALVLIAAQADGAKIGRIRLRRVPNASSPTLTEAVGQGVELGSQVLTDGWSGYAQLATQGYRHEIVRPTAIVGENLLPRANRVASLLQRWLLGTHQGAVRAAHLDYYLDEFTFRFNRRTSRSRGKLFYRLLQQAVQVEPSPYKNMVGGRPLLASPQPVGSTGVN
ncbi:MAG: IS1595 family transposase [Verrucomicrobia bacterium]|nr:IS1595 family transposase [Verrucomicrobiota bacterium]